jgi:hypothetical protein
MKEKVKVLDYNILGNTLILEFENGVAKTKPTKLIFENNKMYAVIKLKDNRNAKFEIDRKKFIIDKIKQLRG